jgi:quercetin dioxygenase-like cupin family protein
VGPDTIRACKAHGVTDDRNPVLLDELGKKLRELRTARELSLADVAEATSLSPSFLSLVETGKSDISIGRLLRLLAFHGKGLADLLPSASHDAQVVRADERRHIRSKVEGIDQYLLAPDTNRTIMPLLVSYVPGGHTLEYTSHVGEEWIHVLEGKMQLDLEGRDPVVLEPGDSAYFRADQPHSLSNIGSSTAWLIAAISPPTW